MGHRPRAGTGKDRGRIVTIPVPEPLERLQSLMKLIGDPGTCRGCAAPIVWVSHRNGKKTPYDADGETAGTNHFITCPKREQFKKAGA